MGIRSDSARRVSNALVTSKHIAKNVLSTPIFSALRKRLFSSPFGPGGGSSSEWVTRRSLQVRELVDAYAAAWPDDWQWLLGKVAGERGSGVDFIVPYTLCTLGAAAAYATDVGHDSVFEVPNGDMIAAVKADLDQRSGIPAVLNDDAMARVDSKGGITAECITDLAGPGSVDLIVSTSTLEHVLDSERAVRSMYSALRPAGRMVHAIAMGNHCCGGGEHERLAHLVYPEWLWQAMFSRRVGHNRLRWFEWERLFKAANFRIVVAKIHGAATAIEVEQIRPRLAPRFCNMSAEELAPSYAVVCCEKL